MQYSNNFQKGNGTVLRTRWNKNSYLQLFEERVMDAGKEKTLTEANLSGLLL